jgi:hypothetical protein
VGLKLAVAAPALQTSSSRLHGIATPIAVIAAARQATSAAQLTSAY